MQTNQTKLQPVELGMWFFIKAGFGLAMGASSYFGIIMILELIKLVIWKGNL